MNREISEIMAAARAAGWVLEPDAKRLLACAGIAVPRFRWAHSRDEAVQAAGEIGYPVVVKVVSPQILHKSDVGGVLTGVATREETALAFDRLSGLPGFAGVLVEEMLSGLEMIIGARLDYQFGPIILLGVGGTRAEIYRDVSIRMAPLKAGDTDRMLGRLQAHALLEGFRGAAPVDRKVLEDLLLQFSGLVMELGESFASIDMNPVLCSEKTCVAADARIMLPTVNSAANP